MAFAFGGLPPSETVWAVTLAVLTRIHFRAQDVIISCVARDIQRGLIQRRRLRAETIGVARGTHDRAGSMHGTKQANGERGVQKNVYRMF